MKNVIAIWDANQIIPSQIIEKISEYNRCQTIVFVFSSDDDLQKNTEFVRYVSLQEGKSANIYDELKNVEQIVKYIIIDKNIAEDFVFLDANDIESLIEYSFKLPISLLRRLLPLLVRRRNASSAKIQLVDIDSNEQSKSSILDLYITNILKEVPFTTIEYEYKSLLDNKKSLLTYLLSDQTTEGNLSSLKTSQDSTNHRDDSYKPDSLRTKESLHHSEMENSNIKSDFATNFNENQFTKSDVDKLDMSDIDFSQLDDENIDNENLYNNKNDLSSGDDKGISIHKTDDFEDGDEFELDEKSLESLFSDDDLDIDDMIKSIDGVDDNIDETFGDLTFAEQGQNDEFIDIDGDDHQSYVRAQQNCSEFFKERAISMAKESLKNKLNASKDIDIDNDVFDNVDITDDADIPVESIINKPKISEKPKVSSAELKAFIEFKRQQELNNKLEQNDKIEKEKELVIKTKIELEKLKKAELQRMEAQKNLSNTMDIAKNIHADNNSNKKDENKKALDEKDTHSSKTLAKEESDDHDIQRLSDEEIFKSSKDSNYDEIISQFKSIWNRK